MGSFEGLNRIPPEAGSAWRPLRESCPLRPWGALPPTPPCEEPAPPKRHTNPESAGAGSGRRKNNPSSLKLLTDGCGRGVVGGGSVRREEIKASVGEDQAKVNRRPRGAFAFSTTSRILRWLYEPVENVGKIVPFLGISCEEPKPSLATTSCVQSRLPPLDMGMVNDKTHPAKETAQHADR